MWIKKLVKYNNKSLSYLCFLVLCFCLIVILWGAWVRISHSGEGCGKSWPSCHGTFILSTQEAIATWIEWIHRATSGLLGVMVLLLSFLCFFKFRFSNPIYKSALLMLFFTLSEALIGARLVLTGLTGNNTSLMRILTMNLHLLNSLLLVSSIFTLWRLLKGKCFSVKNYINNKKYFFILFLFFVICFFGSVSSLAASLFPSTSLLKGMLLDFNSTSHWLIRWRILHPILALFFIGSLILYSYFKNISAFIQKRSPLIISIYLIMFSGVINLLFLSPVFLKLLHLLLIYLLIMSFILSLETSKN